MFYIGHMTGLLRVDINGIVPTRSLVPDRGIGLSRQIFFIGQQMHFDPLRNIMAKINVIPNFVRSNRMLGLKSHENQIYSSRKRIL
jgi:hypothetical protein